MLFGKNRLYDAIKKYEMNHKNYIVFIFFAVFLTINSFATIDSLKNQLKSAKNDSIRVQLMNRIAYKYSYKTPDSAFYFAQKAYDIAIENDYFTEAANSCLNISNIFYYKSDYIETTKYIQKALDLFKKTNDTDNICVCYERLGVIHSILENYETAEPYFKKALDIALEMKDTVAISSCYNNLGSYYRKVNNYKKSLTYHKKALHVSKLKKHKSGVAYAFGNIASDYKSLGKINDAILYSKKAIALMEELGEEEALAYMFGNIASFYNSIGDSLNNNNYYFLAVEYGKKSVEIALQRKNNNALKNAHLEMSLAYEKLGDNKKALQHYKAYTINKDSIFNKEKMQEVEEIEAQFQSKQKEERIKLQEAVLAKNKLKLKQRKTQRNLFIIAFVLMVSLVIVVYRNLKIKNRSNIILTQQKAEIIEKNEELNQLNHEISAQKDEILKIHTNVTDSIKYAKKIQTALLPQTETLDLILEDYFIMYKPLEIVSGDFFWARKLDNIIHLAVADCTGHGVPGAFMSVLGIAYLNEITRIKSTKKANEILDELRDEIKQSLGQKGVEFETNDGMDISFCSINTNNLQAQFSGAYNHLYLLRDKEIQVYKGDRQPIAIYDNEKPFTNHTIQLQKRRRPLYVHRWIYRSIWW
jgi:tetratricopeptide (TPR) repeat protein/serine phosphatase RsbU (regulator of sigma subunit)